MLPITSNAPYPLPRDDGELWSSWCPDFEKDTDPEVLARMRSEIKADLFGPDSGKRKKRLEQLGRKDDTGLDDYLTMKLIIEQYSSRNPDRKILACRHMQWIVGQLRNSKQMARLMPTICYCCENAFRALGKEATRCHKHHLPPEKQPMAAHFARLNDLELWFGYHYARDGVKYLTREHRSNLRNTMLVQGFQWKGLWEKPDLRDIADFLVRVEHAQSLLQCKNVALQLSEITTVHLPDNMPQYQLAPLKSNQPDNNNPLPVTGTKRGRKPVKRRQPDTNLETPPTSPPPKRQRTNPLSAPPVSNAPMEVGPEGETGTGQRKVGPKPFNKNRPWEHQEDTSSESDKHSD